MSNATAAVSRTNPFWTFSLDLYGSPAVQQACIDLQDGSGVDVNVMLYMLWLASEGRRLTAAQARSVVDMLEPWRAGVVVPLRTARRNLKAPPAAVAPEAAESLRLMVKKLELEAERLQQQALHGWRPLSEIGVAEASPGLAAAANLTAYGEALGRQLAPAPVGVMLSALDQLLARPGNSGQSRSGPHTAT